MTRQKSRAAMEVKPVTSKNGDGRRLVSEIDRWRREHDDTPSSVDVLLAHPFVALAMSLHVGVAIGRITPAVAATIRKSIDGWGASHEPEVKAINAICGAALNARKRGLLKSIQRKPKGAK